MKLLSILSLLILGAFAYADDVITYNGACMVYSGGREGVPFKTLVNTDVTLSKSAKVLYKSKGYSFEVEQVDMTFVDDNNRVEHGLILRIMKGNQLVSWAESEIGTSKGSGAIMMNRGLPTISCAKGK